MKVGNWRWAIGLAVAGLYLGGCAQNVPDIDRTQPNKIEKAQFQNDDEWYYRQTIVETDHVGSSGGLGAFEALEGPLYRVRWTITEDVLYAMSTVEPADGVYDGQLEEDGRRIGVVAAFPITGHFDVQRGYNPSTGEQSNIISENASDREWYDRKYMRVDWSTNLAGTMSQINGILGTFAATSRAVPQDDRVVDPDRTRISDTNIDTVTEYFYEPDRYACYTTLGYDAIFSCEGGPVRVRNSFAKLPEQETYVPFEYTDNVYVDDDNSDRLWTMNLYDPNSQKLFEVACDEEAKQYDRDQWGSSVDDACAPATFDLFTRFGYFRTERVAFDERRGSSYEPSRRYYANRFNIWKTMLREDGTVMPKPERTPKPIVYYTNPEYPRDMWGPAQEVAEQWDAAFLESVSLAKGISIEDVKKELVEEYGEGNDHMYAIEWNSCSAPMLTKWAKNHGASNGADRMDVSEIVADFKTKWSTGEVEDDLLPEGGDSELYSAVWASPHDARTQLCADLEFATEPRDEGGFTWQRVGDVRYSFFNWVVSDVPWGGYGPSAADPLTGEIVSGNANYAGTSLKMVAAYGADLVMYLNGDLDEEDLAYGDHVRDYLNEQIDTRTTSQPLSPEGKRELASRTGLPTNQISPTDFEQHPSMEELPDFVHQFGPRGVMEEAHRNSRANALSQASDTKALEFYTQPGVQDFLMKDPNMRVMVESTAAATFGPDFSDEDLGQAYVDAMSPHLAHARNTKRNALLMEQSIMLQENQYRAVENLVTYAGLANAYKGKSRDELEKLFADNLFVGTQLHEVGHTVGLRHNFGASMDALNYHDEYWEIQRKIANEEITPDERWSLQGEIAKEIAGEDVEYLNEAEFRLASVMDYTGDLTGRFAGLGKYDKAAVNFAYAGMVEQFKSDTELEGEHRVGKLNNRFRTQMWLGDYTELPRIFADQAGSGVASDSDTQLKGIDVIQNGREWVSIQEAITQHRLGVETNLENWRNDEFTRGTEPWIDRTVPYEFCTDDRANYQLGCDVFDFGANQREIVNHNFTYYRVMQPIFRYNRGKINRGWENVNGYANFVFNTMKAVERPFRYYSYFQWYDLGAYTDDLREASIDAINFYAELMATPNPGRYCLYNGETARVGQYWYYGLDNVYVPASWDGNRGECASFIDVPKGPGQFYNYDFTNEYDYRVTRVGTWIDKYLASQALFQISANYVDSAFLTDSRATNLSYWTLFQDEMLGFLRGTIIGDYKGFAGVYNRQTGTYERPKLVDTKTFGKGVPSDQEGMDRIYARTSFTHQFWMLANGMIYNSTYEDRYTDFAQYVKLGVANDELQPFPEASEIHEFVHPTTGQIYVAAQTTDGNSIAVDLVDWANVLRQRFVEARETLDAAQPDTPEYETAREVFEGRSQQMEDVVAKMDLVRFVYDALGAGALR